MNPGDRVIYHNPNPPLQPLEGEEGTVVSDGGPASVFVIVDWDISHLLTVDKRHVRPAPPRG